VALAKGVNRLPNAYRVSQVRILIREVSSPHFQIKLYDPQSGRLDLAKGFGYDERI
jgi:hypothetical protein